MIAVAIALLAYSHFLSRQMLVLEGKIKEARGGIREIRRTSLNSLNEFKIWLLNKRDLPVAKIFILPVYEEIVCMGKGKTLMQNAHQNGVGIPSSCGGISQCGTCKVKVISGEEHIRGITEGERHILDMYDFDSAVRFSCTLHPKGNMVVQIYSEQYLFDTVAAFPTKEEIKADGDAFGIYCQHPPPLDFLDPTT